MATRISGEDYVNLLLEACYSRGLLGWLHHTTTAQVVAAMGTFETWHTLDPFETRWLVEESTSDTAAILEQDRNVRRLNRRELLETHNNTYGKSIRDLAYHRYLQLGGTSQDWLVIKRKFPNNTLLHWMVALWEREENGQAIEKSSTKTLAGCHLRGHSSKVPRPVKDDRICLIVLGDVPQEPGYEGDEGVWDMVVKRVHTQFYVNRDTSFTNFQENIAEFPLIRYHITKHNPGLADVVFVSDDKVYPPGLHVSRNEEGHTTRPGRFPRRAELVYDSEPGRSWWSAVIDTSSHHDPTAYRTLDWHALDTEEDWNSLLRVLRSKQGKRVAYLYHLSVKERIQFVQSQVHEEKRYMASHQGYKVFNFLLKRHRDEEKDGGLDSLCGARKDCSESSTNTLMEES